MSKRNHFYDSIPEITITTASGKDVTMWNRLLMSSFISQHIGLCKNIAQFSCYDMDDIIQELLLSVLKAETLYRSEDQAASPQTYAWRACENRLISLYREQRGAHPHSVELHFDFNDLMSEYLCDLPPKYSSHSDLASDVASAIKHEDELDSISFSDLRSVIIDLRNRQRDKAKFDTIIQMLADGYTQEEIAAELGISQPAVSKRVSDLRRLYHDYACRV